MVKIKVYMSVAFDKHTGYWYWMGILEDGIGAAKQSGFSSKEEAEQTARKQTFKKGCMQVWSN